MHFQKLPFFAQTISCRWRISTTQGGNTLHLAESIANFDLFPMPEQLRVYMGFQNSGVCALGILIQRSNGSQTREKVPQIRVKFARRGRSGTIRHRCGRRDFGKMWNNVELNFALALWFRVHACSSTWQAWHFRQAGTEEFAT